ncbi:MAG: SIS domain-containing protein [Anaerorhabdus sp.]
MSNLDNVIKAIKKEKEAIEVLERSLSEEINRVVDVLYDCKGKVIFIAIGKSGHVAKKLAATFASTGTPSFFLHGTEAMHGDFGMIEEKDVCILISNSGSTKEVVQDIEHIKNIGAITVAFTSKEESQLATGCDLKIIYPNLKEADPIECAPTSSSTMTLVLGDAIACALMEKRNFTKEDFYKFHPGGSLGKRLGNTNE